MYSRAIQIHYQDLLQNFSPNPGICLLLEIQAMEFHPQTGYWDSENPDGGSRQELLQIIFQYKGGGSRLCLCNCSKLVEYLIN